MLFHRLFRVSKALLCVGWVLFAVRAHGQSNFGSVSGLITDTSGAAVPQCVITATNPQTGMIRSVNSQESGARTVEFGLKLIF